jgi:hypothetical protein
LSKYPSQLDTNAELTPVADNVTELTSEHINALRNAIFAIERTLGVNPHGSATDLKTRLEQIINPDGTFKSAALVSAGLIALPITNTMIGGSAAISESKLDLDVGTQTLQNQISSNDIDIAALQSLYNSLLYTYNNHANGIAQRHDGYDIDIAGGLSSAPTVGTIGHAVDFIYNSLLSHKDPNSVEQHAASSITYIPDLSGPITAYNVQDAITQVDSAFQEDRRIHNAIAHDNGIVTDGYAPYTGRSDSHLAALRTSIFQPSSSRAEIKIGHISAASIKTLGLNPLAISASAQNLDFTIKSGTSVRTFSVTGLHTATYPVTYDKYPIKALVNYLNAAFANTADQISLQAYDAGDGEIIIQHNIDRDDCTITLTTPAVNSALGAFGWTDLVGIVFSPRRTTQAYIDGYQLEALKKIHEGAYTLMAPFAIIDLGVVSGSSGLNLKVGSLVHIYNHSSSNGARTHRITSVPPPPSTQISVDTPIDAGTFNYIIYEDTAYIPSGGNPRSIDIFYNSNQTIEAQVRYEVSLAPISNIQILEVTPQLSGSGFLQLVTGSPNTLQLTINSQSGAAAAFYTGYIGEVKVYAADGINYITCLISSTTLLPTTSTITIYPRQSSHTQMLLGSSYYNGANSIYVPVDKTNVGSVGINEVSSSFIKERIDTPLSLICGAGVISGLQVTSPSSTTLEFTGGQCVVSGKIIQVAKTTISVFNTVSATGLWNAIVNNHGNIELLDDSQPGHSIAELATSAEVALLAQFTTLASNITSVLDARSFVNNLSAKHLPTLNTQEGFGTFATLQAAQLYAAESARAVDSYIIATDSIVVSSSITIAADTILECLSDLTGTSITVDTGATLYVRGNLTASSITLQSSSTLVVDGQLTISGTLTLSSSTQMQINDTSSVGSISFTGDNNLFVGKREVELNLLGVITPGISIAAANNIIRNIQITIPNSANTTVIQTSAGASETLIDNCTITRLGAAGSWSSNQIGIQVADAVAVSHIEIRNTTISNFYTAIDIASTAVQVGRVEIFECNIYDCNSAIKSNKTDALTIAGNTFSSIYDEYILLDPSGINSLHADVSIIGNRFIQEYSGGSGLCIKAGSKLATLRVKDNVFDNITSSGHIVDCTYTLISDQASYAVESNIFLECNTPVSGTEFAISYHSIDGGLICANNIFSSHYGAMLSAMGPATISNNLLISQSAEITPYATIVLQSDFRSIFSSNLLSTSSDQLLSLSESVVRGNIIEVGYIDIAAVNAKDIIVDNYILLSSVSAADSIHINYTTTSQNYATISDNIIFTNATTYGIHVEGDGSIVFSGNIISPLSPCSAILFAALAGSTGTQTLLSNNVFAANYSTVTNTLLIEKHSTSIVGNLLYSSVSSPTTSSVNINGATLSNIVVQGNILGNASTAGRQIISTSTVDVLIENNKNAESKIQTSALSGIITTTTGSLTTSGWTVDTGGLFLNSTSATTYNVTVPLTKMPIGARLVSCSIYGASSSVGSFTIQLFVRDLGAGTAATSISSTASNVGTGAITITATPTSTHYISQNKEYLLKITSTQAGNQLGNISAIIYN